MTHVQEFDDPNREPEYQIKTYPAYMGPRRVKFPSRAEIRIAVNEMKRYQRMKKILKRRVIYRKNRRIR